MYPYTSVIGLPKEALDTPALLVDLEKMGRNIARMASTMRDNQVDWRPHVKCPKVPAIAHRLLDAGAIGVTCAKLGEAEVMAASGIRKHTYRQSGSRSHENKQAGQLAAQRRSDCSRRQLGKRCSTR